jgi:hypothetical protein
MRKIIIVAVLLLFGFNTYSQSNSYPYYPISVVTTEDSIGRADSITVYCKLSGVVYGGNFRPGALDFQILDYENGKQVGIQVFNFNSLGYTVKEGDSIDVYGAIEQFQGRTEIFADSIVRLDSFRSVPAPVKVTGVNEATESKLVTYRNLVVQSISGSSSYNIMVTDGYKNFQVRIDRDAEIADSLLINPINIGDTICSVTGFGAQYDASLPHLSGYQIFPYYYHDIEINNCSNPCQMPNSDFTLSSDTICQGDTLFLSNNSTAINSSSTFYWDFENDGIVDSESLNSFVQYANPGNYEVELTVMNEFCTDTIVKSVEVTSPSIPFYETTRACIGEAFTLPDSTVIQVFDTIN